MKENIKEDVKKSKKESTENQKKDITEEKLREDRRTDEKRGRIKDNKTRQKLYKNRKIHIIVISIVLIIILLVISTIFSIINLGKEKIINGVSIEGLDISGLSKTEAVEKLNQLYQEKKEKEIGLKYEDYLTTLNLTVMEVNYEVEKAVDEAYLIGRNSNIFVNNYAILFTLIGKRNIDVNMNLNEDITKQTIEDIGVNLPGVVVDSSYSIEGNKLIVTKGKKGISIDYQTLINKVKDNLNNINIINEDIEIPVVSKEPQNIDIQKIHDEIYKETKDAYYTKNPFTVYPEVEGINFDVETAKTILQEEKEIYEIPLTITKPKVTIKDIGTEAFPDKLSTFTTRYDVSSVDRTTNLRLACEKINEKVVLPGETFSYNKALGVRSAATGYKNAKVYSNGEVVDGIGGGICQISSTLYNSALMANLEIVERRNHQFVTSYVPAGRDATVVYGMTDFKFKNTRKYPIRIVASAQNGIATVSLYGIKEEEEYTFTFSTKTVTSIPFTTKYVDDNTLSLGKERVKQKGANGLKTETYLTKMLNGKVISTKLLSKDTYDAMTRIILRNTKSKETDNFQKNENTNKNNSENNTIEQEETVNKQQNSNKVNTNSINNSKINTNLTNKEISNVNNF